MAFASSRGIMRALSAIKHPGVARSPARLRVLVKEAGSPRLDCGGAEGYDETVIIAQMKGESPAEFSERALERLEALARSGKALCAITLQTGIHHDRATSAARAAILTALAAYARRGGSLAELLVEAASTGADDRSQLMGLVDQLLTLPEGEALPVRLRFREVAVLPEDADSGVFWVSPKGA